MELEILYNDEELVAINKPHGLLVHRSKIADDVREFAVQLLRDQIGQRVSPVHRLDRKTSGVLIFALNDSINKKMNALFDEGMVKKTYLAIVRGHTPDEFTIDYPLAKENGNLQDAVTHFKTLEKVEIDVPFGRYQTQRYSLVEVKPDTGRMHQIRRHFNHLRHPIIGDRPHGCNKQNKLFKQKWNMTTMLLHARSVSLIHPLTNEPIFIKADLQSEFDRMLNVLGFKYRF